MIVTSLDPVPNNIHIIAGRLRHDWLPPNLLAFSKLLINCLDRSPHSLPPQQFEPNHAYVYNGPEACWEGDVRCSNHPRTVCWSPVSIGNYLKILLRLGAVHIGFFEFKTTLERKFSAHFPTTHFGMRSAVKFKNYILVF